MARPAPNIEHVTELAERLTALRENRPGIIPSYKSIERFLLLEFGYEASAETIRKAHDGQSDPDSMSLDLLLGLAAFYEVDPAALGARAEARIKRAMAMLGRHPVGPDEGSGQEERPSA